MMITLITLQLLSKLDSHIGKKLTPLSHYT